MNSREKKETEKFQIFRNNKSPNPLLLLTIRRYPEDMNQAPA